MAGSLIQATLGDVRGLHEAVVMLAVHLAGVILHSVDDGGTLRVEDGQTRTNLIREGEQIHFGAKLAVVALRGLLQTGLVGLQILLGGECRTVDALQHRVRLAATPVCGGGTLNLERLDVAGVRQMRAAAQVLPDHIAVTVDVVVEAQFLAADFSGSFRIEVGLLVLDKLELVRLIGLFGEGFLLGHHAAAEGLGGLDDALHALFDLFEILRSERGVHIEIVVEAVLDDRSDAEFGVRTDFLYGLGHDVGRGVAHDGHAVLAIEGDGLHNVAVVQLGVEVARFAVQTNRDDVLVIREELDAGLVCRHLLRFAVECDGDGLFSHEMSFAIGVRVTNVQAWTKYQR